MFAAIWRVSGVAATPPDALRRIFQVTHLALPATVRATFPPEAEPCDPIQVARFGLFVCVPIAFLTYCNPVSRVLPCEPVHRKR